jgi:hypothetical protein
MRLCGTQAVKFFDAVSDGIDQGLGLASFIRELRES